MNLKFRAWNVIVRRFQYFTLEDIEKQKDSIQWHILKIDFFTGLYDVNGKEIYTNDICFFDTTEADRKPIGLITYNYNTASVCFKGVEICRIQDSGFYQPDISPYNMAGLKVIGNNYQHKNLLTDQ